MPNFDISSDGRYALYALGITAIVRAVAPVIAILARASSEITTRLPCL